MAAEENKERQMTEQFEVVIRGSRHCYTVLEKTRRSLHQLSRTESRTTAALHEVFLVPAAVRLAGK